MKILFISRCPLYPIHWGDRMTIYHITRELADAGHTIDLLAYTQLDDDADWLPHYEQFFRHIELLPEPHRSPISLLKRLFIPQIRFPTNATGAWGQEMWSLIERYLRNNDYDAVHLFGGIHVYEFYHLVKNHNALVMPYDSYALYLRRIANRVPMNLLHRIRWWIAHQYEGFMFAPFDKAIVLAQPDYDEVHQANPQTRLHIVPNGVNTDDFKPRDIERDEATLLFVGNYEYPPNLEAAFILVNAILPQVRHKIPHAKLQLVGNAPPPELQALASEYIEITGRVPDVKDYLAQATVMVSPLQVGSGMKTKVLEAMSMGMPMVATPLSVDGIAVTDGVHTWVRDKDGMPSAIIDLINDKQMQAQFSHESRALIEAQYSWRAIAERYVALYAEND